VVTTPQIAATLTQRIHFNTFGGNPVVCAQGKAVLEVIERENLQANSLRLGAFILAGLEKLKAKHNIIGDVRGKGLLIGSNWSRTAPARNRPRPNARKWWKPAATWACWSAKADCGAKPSASRRRCHDASRRGVSAGC
jgi:4-aminobutyrate aminotransferase-like enzyme